MKATKRGKKVFPGNDLVDARLQKDHDLRLLASEYRRKLLKARAGKDANAATVVIKKFLPQVRKLTNRIDPPVSPLLAFSPPWPPDFQKPPELPPILPPHAMGLDFLEFAKQPITICDVYEVFSLESAAFRIFKQIPEEQNPLAEERAGKAAVGRAAAGRAFRFACCNRGIRLCFGVYCSRLDRRNFNQSRIRAQCRFLLDRGKSG